MIYSIIRTFMVDYCLEVFFNKVQQNLRTNPRLNQSLLEQFEISHFLEKHFESYIMYIANYERGHLSEETFRRWLQAVNLRTPTDNFELLYQGFETMAAEDLEPVGYIDRDGNLVEEAFEDDSGL